MLGNIRKARFRLAGILARSVPVELELKARVILWEAGWLSLADMLSSSLRFGLGVIDEKAL